MNKAKSNATGNGVRLKARESSVALLNQALADLGDLYSQTKQAHWNVRGKNFYPHHLLFDAVAETAEAHWDDVAERAIQLGGYARGTSRMTAKGNEFAGMAGKSDHRGRVCESVDRTFHVGGEFHPRRH